MFAPECQKKFQVVQSVTALSCPRGGGRAGPRPGVQMGRRKRRNALWRAASTGPQSERGAEQAWIACPGDRRGQSKQPTEGSRFRRRRYSARTARSSCRQAGAGSVTSSGTVHPATRTARAPETERARWLGRTRPDEPRAESLHRAAGKTRRRTMPELSRCLDACS